MLDSIDSCCSSANTRVTAGHTELIKASQLQNKPFGSLRNLFGKAASSIAGAFSFSARNPSSSSSSSSSSTNYSSSTRAAAATAIATAPLPAPYYSAQSCDDVMDEICEDLMTSVACETSLCCSAAKSWGDNDDDLERELEELEREDVSLAARLGKLEKEHGCGTNTHKNVHTFTLSADEYAFVSLSTPPTKAKLKGDFPIPPETSVKSKPSPSSLTEACIGQIAALQEFDGEWKLTEALAKVGAMMRCNDEGERKKKSKKKKNERSTKKKTLIFFFLGLLCLFVWIDSYSAAENRLGYFRALRSNRE